MDHPREHPSGTASIPWAQPPAPRAARRPFSSFETHAPSRKVFLAEKSNESSVDPKNYFGRGRRRSPRPSPAAAPPAAPAGRLQKGHCTPSLPSLPRFGAPDGQGGCAIPLHTFQLGPYPFRPPAGFVIQRKLVRSLDKQTGNQIFRCAYTLSAGG